MKAKIDSAKAGRTFEGNNGTVQVYEVVAGGIIYDCLNKKCTELVGQEVEFDVKKASDPKYHDTMKLAGSGGSQQAGGGKYGNRPFTIGFNQTIEGARLQAKEMALAYSKDVAIALAQPPNVTLKEVKGNIIEIYNMMIDLLDLAKLQEPKQQQPSGNGHKDVNALLSEMKPIASLEALATWWKSTVVPIYTALSEHDQKTLQVEKDKKKTELTPPPTNGSQTGKEAPF